jgi:apolipoprotein N-acyltransferase
VPFAVAGGLVVWIGRRGDVRWSIAAFVPVWLVAEFLPAQRWLLGDFASALTAVGYTQFDTPLRGLAAWSGVSAASLAVLVVNVAWVLALRDRRVAPAVVAAVVVAAWLAVPVPGAAADAVEREPLRIAIAQGAVSSVDSLMARFDRDAARRMLEPYAELTRAAAERKADLIVWGETVLPQPVREGHVPDYVAEALEPAPRALVGGVAYDGERSYNSVFHWQDGDLVEVYRKRALVPINERRYTSGRALPPLDVDGVALGMGVCLDSVFGSLAREAVRAGARILVYVTEDSFAGRTVTPELHVRVTAFRAVETGRWVVFANQSGPSAVVDRHGNVIERIEQGDAAGVVVAVPAHAGMTPFVRFGDWVGWACVLASVAGIAAIARGRSSA